MALFVVRSRVIQSVAAGLHTVADKKGESRSRHLLRIPTLMIDTSISQAQPPESSIALKIMPRSGRHFGSNPQYLVYQMDSFNLNYTEEEGPE